MSAKNTNTDAEKKREEEAWDKFRQGSLSLLTQIASTKRSNREALYEWNLRPKSQIDKELRWAAQEELLNTTKGGRIVDGVGLSLSRKGFGYVMLYWIARHGGATTDHMVKRFGRTKSSRSYTTDSKLYTREVLKDLEKQNLLRLAGAMNFESLLYGATGKGLNLTGWGKLPVLRIVSLDEGHLRAEVEMAISLELDYGPEGSNGLFWEVWGERQLGLYNRGKSGEDRLASPPYHLEHESKLDESKKYKRPDLLLLRRSPDSDLLYVEAIEMELTAKSPEELDAIFISYSTCKTISVVRYYVSPRVRNTITDVAERLQARVDRELQEGGRDLSEVTEIKVIPLEPALVPARRRARHYLPEPLSGSEDLYKRKVRGAGWSEALRLDVLKTVQWVTRNGVVTPDAVSTWLGLGDIREADDLLGIAHGAEWLEYSDILRAEGGMFFATEKGRETVGLDMPEYEIDFKSESHHTLTQMLCANARVSARLSHDFPKRRVISAWELRCDSMFSKEKLLEVADAGEGVGKFRSPHLLIMGKPRSGEAPQAALVMPHYIQGSRLKLIGEAWLKREDISRLHLFIGYESVLKAAEDAVKDLNAADRIEIHDLPVSPRREDPLVDTDSLKGCSLPSESRTAWTNT